MAAAGWFDDGTGRQRWWDGERWTDRYQDAEADSNPVGAPAVVDGPGPLRVFRGNGTAGSVSLTVYPALVEYEHHNYVVAVPKAQVGPISYSKKLKAPYDGVAVTSNIDFHSDDPKGVYDYLRSYLAGR